MFCSLGGQAELVGSLVHVLQTVYLNNQLPHPTPPPPPQPPAANKGLADIPHVEGRLGGGGGGVVINTPSRGSVAISPGLPIVVSLGGRGEGFIDWQQGGVRRRIGLPWTPHLHPPPLPFSTGRWGSGNYIS